MNDTIALMGTPIMISLARRMKMDDGNPSCSPSPSR